MPLVHLGTDARGINVIVNDQHVTDVQFAPGDIKRRQTIVTVAVTQTNVLSLGDTDTTMHLEPRQFLFVDDQAERVWVWFRTQAAAITPVAAPLSDTPPEGSTTS
jgi:hypothetical protein